MIFFLKGSHPMTVDDFLMNVNPNNNELKKEIFVKLFSMLQNRQSLVINLNDSNFYHLGN